MTRHVDTAELTAKLRRAHRMSCSDPNDPTRHTMYGDAADTIDQLATENARLRADHARATVTYGVVLDTDGSTDVYDTEDEARAQWAPGCRIIRIETLDTDITNQVTR